MNKINHTSFLNLMMEVFPYDICGNAFTSFENVNVSSVVTKLILRSPERTHDIRINIHVPKISVSTSLDTLMKQKHLFECFYLFLPQFGDNHVIFTKTHQCYWDI